jgi:ribosomal protein S18 acetylase RimI-like enzyme
MIRPTIPADTPTLLALAKETGVFKPMEIQALQEVLDDYHESDYKIGHVSVTCEEDGEIIGFAYYAPASMTERSWYLYWIAVHKGTQARGVGSKLMRYLEEDIRRRQPGATLFIETSSMPHYDLTRKFYLKHGYDQEAVLRDYYAPGDSMVVFRKVLL